MIKSIESNDLCLECGLCCNGVLFADGQLQPDDNSSRLEKLGLKLKQKPKTEGAKRKFIQPCAAFDGCRCGIYTERPAYCRQFECLLLKRVASGETSRTEASRIVSRARCRVSKVKRLLRDLGDADESVALSIRFRRMARQLESRQLDSDAAERFSELTLAAHDLNMLLAEAFYPGAE